MKTLPGMSKDGQIEFYKDENSIKIMENGKVKDFTEISLSTLDLLKNKIKEDKEIELILHDLYPTSEIRRIEQFVSCRFGGLDFQADIIDNEIQDGEWHECSFRNQCPYNGKLCKLPKASNGKRLTEVEVNLIKETSTEKTNEHIAEFLGVCLGTFHLLKKNLYQKLQVQTKQAVAIFGFMNNII